MTVSYEGILPDLFREGQGVVVQGILEKGNHVLAHEVLAKHDENYTRRKWKRRCRKTTAARNALIRTPHHDA
ncbi:cytochrome c-type biogenesis protein CcmE [Salmonella enterica subsp. enterica serovar Daytona]|uniref:Cytochrome c-type biogenesis protein CcmE n=1 Tax=Salmonella enterica subsp. enterica serovar Daytona TaxID=1962639 RepID=A0A447J9Y5_SALET|nr:cytochrome c-type biogenesis protein CcmE [Salmonella enterica subsp. enterica serovar Daytona]